MMVMMAISRASTFFPFQILMSASNDRISLTSTRLAICEDGRTGPNRHEIVHNELSLTQIKRGVLGATFG